MKITVLVEDSKSMDKPELMAKHGLSFLLETKIMGMNSKLLMDVGPEPNIALKNARCMGLDIKDIDGIFITHGHYDHVGAILKVLEYVNRPVPVVAHPEIFNPKFTYKPKLTSIGFGYGSSDVQTRGGILLLVRNSFEITRGVMTSGEIPRKTVFEEIKGLWTIKNYCFIEDSMVDEQSLFINIKNKGLVILIGCGHLGIVNIIKHAQDLTGIKKVHAIIGGMHLGKSDRKKIMVTVKELSRINFDSIYPCHCTSTEAINQFLNSFEERCVPIRTGSILEF
ncbi:hypothetical protein AC481_02710 [miscellaneous Crenarchaeota group archaeon SMTZ-80]|nr:MAG: hypothetical protein AC481_02710 [miscellaneous Crenarchaeota group archaeon SMTZ-80]